MICETIEELQKFAASTTCAECRKEAQDMIAVLDRPGTRTIKIYFDTECEHANKGQAREWGRFILTPRH